MWWCQRCVNKGHDYVGTFVVYCVTVCELKQHIANVRLDKYNEKCASEN